MTDEFKLLCKNPEGSQYKWSNAGNLKKNEWGNWSIGLQVSRLKEAIVNAERDNKSYINLSAFEDKPPVNEPNPAPSQVEAKPEFAVEELDDEIPF